MKLCKDCKWAKPPNGGDWHIPGQWDCTHELAHWATSVVNGVKSYSLCYIMRDGREGKCGLEAKLWEPIETRNEHAQD